MFYKESSSFPGQFQPQGQLSYADSVAFYGDDLVNGVEHLQQHHHSQNYAHLQQRKKSFIINLFHLLILPS